MIDRIVHHADVIVLKGTSYRIKHTAIESCPPSKQIVRQTQPRNTCSLFNRKSLRRIQPEPTLGVTNRTELARFMAELTNSGEYRNPTLGSSRARFE